MAEEDSLEFVVHGFRRGERGSEGEEIIVGLDISFFKRFFKEFWAITFCGSEILLDGFEIRVTS